MLSLVKLGNIKLGVVRNGKPIQTERLLVTKATKEGEENFSIFPGFAQDGENKLNITLPFDSPELNFEVNYVGFLKINDKDYMSKSKGFGETIYLYPLNVEDFDCPIYTDGVLNEDKILHYGMERTGFLKVMIKDISGFGEVFYFKTKSINSIRTINDQLQILSSLTGGKLIGVPLVLKPIKKDIDGKQIVYVSISFEGNIHELSNPILDRAESSILFEKYEELYSLSRIPSETKELNPEAIIKVEKDVELEMKEISIEAEKTEEDENGVRVKEIVGENFPVPLPILKNIYIKVGEEQFIALFEAGLSVERALIIQTGLIKGKSLDLILEEESKKQNKKTKK